MNETISTEQQNKIERLLGEVEQRELEIETLYDKSECQEMEIEMLRGEVERLKRQNEVMREALQGVINSAVNPDKAVRSVMVSLEPIRAALTLVSTTSNRSA